MSPRRVFGRTNRAEVRHAKLHHETTRGTCFVHQAAVEVVGFAHFLQMRVCAIAPNYRTETSARQATLTTPRSCMWRARKRQLSASPETAKGGAQVPTPAPPNTISVGISSLHVANGTDQRPMYLPNLALGY